jgi:transcriptional regulator with XRE-family HTH domain
MEGSMELAKNLTKLCEEKNLSLAKLARLSGVKQPTLHGWTTGRAVHKLDDLKKVCDVLKVNIHFMLYGTPDPHEHPNQILEEVFNGIVRMTLHRVKDT